MTLSNRAVLWIAAVVWGVYALVVGYSTAHDAFAFSSLSVDSASHANRQLLDAIARLLGFAVMVIVLWIALCILLPEVKHRQSFEIKTVFVTCIVFAVVAVFLPSFIDPFGLRDTTIQSEDQLPTTPTASPQDFDRN